MSPRTSKQFEQLRETSRAKIMEAAIELFAKSGYHATSISQIAKKAKVSKGLMYNYFKSKEHLLDEIIGAAMKEGEEPMLAIQALRDPYEKIKMIVEGSVTMLKSPANQRRWQLLLSIMTQYEVMKKLQNYFKSYKEVYLPMLEQVFAELGIPEPQLECYRFGALLDGITLHYLYGFDENYPIDKIKNGILKYYESFRKKKR